MRRALILLYLFSANSEMTYEQVFRSRNSRSYPVHTGYYYRRSSSEPRVVSVFDSNDYSTPSPRSVENVHTEFSSICENLKIGKDASKNIIEYDNKIGYEKARTKCNISPKSDRFRLDPTPSYEVIKRFNRNSDYRADDDDLRTDTNMYNGWPYSYRDPYDYGFNFEPENEKAKDKRFVSDIIERVIPVHEDHEDNIHRHYDSLTLEKERENEDTNPMYGNQAFFSHVLEDYFDRTNEEDPLIFKGLNYNKEFDTLPYKNNHDYNKRFRRLKTYDYHGTPYNNYNKIGEKPTMINNFDDKLIGIEKGYNKMRHLDDKLRKETLNENDKTRYNYNGDSSTRFKDFIDSFINKFGSEDHSKDVDFKVNKTLDKGEKKKGFRRTYHKDEYQEDNEFYDNSNNKSVLTENSGSKLKVGGSEAQLASRASAALGNEASNIKKIGSKDSAKFGDNNLLSHNSDGHDVSLQKFKEIAKNTAYQNNVDYYDHL